MSESPAPQQHTGFEQETIDRMLQSSRFYDNTAQEFIHTTGDKLRLCLLEHREVLKAQTDWIAPLGILLALLAPLLTADFKTFLRISAEIWRTLHIFASIMCFGWLVWAVVRAVKNHGKGDIERIIQALKIETSDTGAEKRQVGIRSRDVKPLMREIPLESIANSHNLTSRYRNPPLGESRFNEVPFLLQRRYFETRADSPGNVELELAEPLRHVSSVHLLVNAGNAWKRHEDVSLSGVTVGRIQFKFSDGTLQEAQLIVGQNVREWAPGNAPGRLVDEVTDKLNRVAWTGTNTTGNKAVIDHLEIPIHEQHKGKDLMRIAVLRDLKPNTPQNILSLAIFAITAECYAG